MPEFAITTKFFGSIRIVGKAAYNFLDAYIDLTVRSKN